MGNKPKKKKKVDICALSCFVKQISSGNLLSCAEHIVCAMWWPRSMEGVGGGDAYIHMADSHHCTAETNTTV